MDRDWPEPQDIFEYYQRSLEALQALDTQPLSSFGAESRFFMMKPAEFHAAVTATRRELDREVSLALLASAEAALRADYDERVRGRRKQPPTIRTHFRRLEADYGDRVRLDDIVRCWKTELAAKPDVFNTFLDYLDLRHWLAHGRHWTLKSSRRPEPREILASLRAMFGLLPGFSAIP